MLHVLHVGLCIRFPNYIVVNKRPHKWFHGPKIMENVFVHRYNAINSRNITFLISGSSNFVILPNRWYAVVFNKLMPIPTSMPNFKTFLQSVRFLRIPSQLKHFVRYSTIFDFEYLCMIYSFFSKVMAFPWH